MSEIKNFKGKVPLPPVPILDFGTGSGVVLYLTPDGLYKFVCVFCKLSPKVTTGMDTPENAMEHLIAHEESGDDVPEITYAMLEDML